MVERENNSHRSSSNLHVCVHTHCHTAKQTDTHTNKCNEKFRGGGVKMVTDGITIERQKAAIFLFLYKVAVEVIGAELE